MNDVYQTGLQYDFPVACITDLLLALVKITITELIHQFRKMQNKQTKNIDTSLIDDLSHIKIWDINF